jgi:hypothetical protein
MSTLERFFKGSDTRFGIFYPQNYLLAIFPNFEEAARAERQLLNAGFLQEDVVAVPGEDVVEHAEEHLKKQGLWSLLMQELSRIFETEEVYADKDYELARQGAGFVAAYCPSDPLKEKAWRAMDGCNPIAARRYALGGIEHLKGEV